MRYSNQQEVQTSFLFDLSHKREDGFGILRCDNCSISIQLTKASKV